jgi:hypothetical protein
VKIEAGKYYERADGQIHLAVKSTDCRDCDIKIGDGYYNSSKGGKHKLADRDIVREVSIVPVLPFTLKAGSKYETVKPSGEAGPVVTLREGMIGRGVEPVNALLPFNADFDGDDYRPHYVTPLGEIYHHRESTPCLRIVREHVPQLTLSQRILQLRSQCLGRGDLAELHAEFESLATDVSKLEAK